MSALRSALLEWSVDRVSRVLIAALAVYLATRVTGDFLVGLGAAVLFAIGLEALWWVAERSGDE